LAFAGGQASASASLAQLETKTETETAANWPRGLETRSWDL